MLDKFIKDKHEPFMYISGPAGTGKTTSLKELVDYCIANDISYRVCAYTHKACEVLYEKLKCDHIITLHSLLGKIPGVNREAKSVQETDATHRIDRKYNFQIMFIDEYSMIGEKDYVDIIALSEDYDIKVVYIGDPHQLPPVKDIQSVSPSGPYQQVLTKIYRNDNPLQQPLQALISYIEGKKPEPLKEVPGYFERGRDLVAEYKEGDILLCFTNRAVQNYNALIHDKMQGTKLYSTQTKKEYIKSATSEFDGYYAPNDTPIRNDKYSTLDKLLDRYKYVKMDNGAAYFTVFGTASYNEEKRKLKQAAVVANNKIRETYKAKNVHEYCQANKSDPLVKDRNKAWADYLLFDTYVLQLDYNHAMTVHKSQGSTYERVLVDTKDIATCKALELQLKLMYVAISRAKKCVITN